MLDFADLAGGTCSHAVIRPVLQTTCLSSRKLFERDSQLEVSDHGRSGIHRIPPIGPPDCRRSRGRRPRRPEHGAHRQHRASDPLRADRVRRGLATDEDLVVGVLESADACFHLASTVGVSLVVDRPVDTLLSNVRGTDVVLSAAAGLRKRAALRLDLGGLRQAQRTAPCDEDADRILGPIQKSPLELRDRKSFGEALALGYVQELGAENTVVRLFNTVGPRQTGMYGMVLPRFVAPGARGRAVTVFGDGTQSRCFAHVYDTVDALAASARCDEAIGRVFNIGTPTEITIMELARRVIERYRLATPTIQLRALRGGLRRGLRGARPPEARHERARGADRLGADAQRSTTRSTT